MGAVDSNCVGALTDELSDQGRVDRCFRRKGNHDAYGSFGRSRAEERARVRLEEDGPLVEAWCVGLGGNARSAPSTCART